jgi:hypothetical protein
MIGKNRQILLSVIVLTVGINYKSEFAIINDDLSYHKVCARWARQQLREEQRHNNEFGPVARNCHKRNKGPSLQTMP